MRIAVLPEHKSYTEPYIHFQLNRYMLTVWDTQLSEKKPVLPIIPVVVYHGRRRWQKRDMRAYFELLPETVAPPTYLTLIMYDRPIDNTGQVT